MNKYITKTTPIIEAVKYRSERSFPSIRRLFNSRIIAGGYIIRKDSGSLLVHLPSGREFFLAKGEYLVWENEDFYCHCQEYMEQELQQIYTADPNEEADVKSQLAEIYDTISSDLKL